MTEAELVQALRSQDQRALAVLYDRYSAVLFNIVLRIVKEEELAEDVLQEAFLKIWLHFSDYQPGKGRLFTWLLNVTRNLAIDTLRSAAYQRRNCTDALPDRPVYQASLCTHQPELLEWEALLEPLGAQERHLIEQIYFQGYTGPEVAAQLCIPLGTLKTRLRVAVAKLRQQWLVEALM